MGAVQILTSKMAHDPLLSGQPCIQVSEVTASLRLLGGPGFCQAQHVLRKLSSQPAWLCRAARDMAPRDPPLLLPPAVYADRAARWLHPSWVMKPKAGHLKPRCLNVTNPLTSQRQQQAQDQRERAGSGRGCGATQAGDILPSAGPLPHSLFFMHKYPEK